MTVTRSIGLVLLAVAVMGISVSCAIRPAEQPEQPSAEVPPGGPGIGYQVGMVAPDLNLPGITGPDLKLGSLRGRVVLLNFWATWCPPCRAEMPELQEFFDQHSDRADLVLVNIEEKKADVTRFMDRDNYTMPVVSISSQAAARDYGVTGIPTTVLIDADGVIRWRRVGTVNVRMLLDAIGELQD